MLLKSLEVSAEVFDKILYGSKLNNYELKNLKNILINSTDNLEKTLKR